MSSVPAHSPVASLPRGEGIALSERLVSHPAACRFAAATGLPSPSQAATGESPYSRADYVRGHVFSLLGRESDGQACNTYDIVWSLALAMDEAGYDPGRVREILPHVAGRWSGLHGASGQVVLNPAGVCRLRLLAGQRPPGVGEGRQVAGRHRRHGVVRRRRLRGLPGRVPRLPRSRTLPGGPPREFPLPRRPASSRAAGDS